MCHSGGGRDLAVGTNHKLGPGEQGEKDLESGRLKGTATFESWWRLDTLLAVDEHQERGLIQERVARRVEEFDSLKTQGVSQGRRYMVGHEKRIATVGSQLMDDRPKRCWPQTPLVVDRVIDPRVGCPRNVPFSIRTGSTGPKASSANSR